MFREIKRPEKITDRFETEKELGYQKIKPKKKLSKAEIEVAFKEIFDEACREHEES